MAIVKRKEKMEREKAAAAQWGTLTSFYADGGLPSTWDAAVEKATAVRTDEIGNAKNTDDVPAAHPSKRKRADDTDYAPDSEAENVIIQHDHNTRRSKRQRGDEREHAPMDTTTHEEAHEDEEHTATVDKIPADASSADIIAMDFANGADRAAAHHTVAACPVRTIENDVPMSNDDG